MLEYSIERWNRTRGQWISLTTTIDIQIARREIKGERLVFDDQVNKDPSKYYGPFLCRICYWGEDGQLQGVVDELGDLQQP